MAAFSTQRGLFGAPMMDRSAEGAGPVQRDAVVPTYKKPSTANLIIGTIGDTLSQIGGGRGNYLPGLQRRQEQAYETQQLQQRRADEYTDWQRKEQYKAEHPGPQEPNALERNYLFLETKAPGLGRTYATNFANNGGGMPQIANVPGVGMVSIPRNTAPAQPAGIPDGAVSMLKQNPAMAVQFDAKYGQGASARYLGGAAPQANAPFPIR